MVGFQPLNHNKRKCKMFPNNNHEDLNQQRETTDTGGRPFKKNGSTGNPNPKGKGKRSCLFPLVQFQGKLRLGDLGRTLFSCCPNPPTKVHKRTTSNRNALVPRFRRNSAPSPFPTRVVSLCDWRPSATCLRSTSSSTECHYQSSAQRVFPASSRELGRQGVRLWPATSSVRRTRPQAGS